VTVAVQVVATKTRTVDGAQLTEVLATRRATVTTVWPLLAALVASAAWSAAISCCPDAAAVGVWQPLSAPRRRSVRAPARRSVGVTQAGSACEDCACSRARLDGE
jgi:hypothetical protein